MPWSSEPPQRVRVFRRAWSSVPIDDAPPRQHLTVWTGIKQVSAPSASAVAVLDAPSAVSSVHVIMPAGGLDGFPYEFPHELTAPLGSLVAVAEMPVPHVGVGMGEVAVPVMVASASAVEPGVASGVVVPMPDGAGGFPHEFPHEFGEPSGSMRAGAGLDVPSVVADVVVAAALMVAAADLLAVDASSSVLVSAVLMAASAQLHTATVAAGVGLTAPAMTATLAADVPGVASGVEVASPVMAAAAEVDVPDVAASSAPAVEAPEMLAEAGLHEPSVVVITTVQVPVMRASAVADGFPYEFPYQFTGPLGMHAPEVASGAEVVAPELIATGDAPVPSVGLGASAAVPAMEASASVPLPVVSRSVTVSAPAMTASAGAHAPSASWTKAPETTAYATAGAHSFNVTAARNAGFTHLVLAGVGGGEAGNNATFITQPGGQSGSWNSTIIALASYPSLATITITVGNGGASNGADGGATSFAGTGLSTVTASGGSGNSGGGNGNGPGNHTVDGDTYTGGATQTSRGAAGNPPGGGGGGGNVFGNGGAGARGQAWIKAKRV